MKIPNTLFLEAGGETSGLVFSTLGAAPILLGTGDIEKARFDAGGNLGIGTETPAQTLHAVGNVQAEGFIMSSDASLKRNIAALDGTEIIKKLRV